jgi:GT2 family glycosyltransferase
MELAVIIPTFNRFFTTKQCVDSLRANKDRNDLIVICDSSSTDGTELIQSFYDNLIFIDVGPSAWWSAAVNVGIKRALDLGYESVLVLNDDLSFDFNLSQSILAAARRHPNSIITASQKVNSKIFIGTKYIGIFQKVVHIYSDPKLNERSSVEVETSNGSCLLIPKAVFQKIGFFDEVRCPHLYGDTQFQLRAYNADIKMICDPSVRVSQQPNTNYIKKLSLSKMFVADGSPLKFSAYWAFCITLFGSRSKALFLGIWHHYYFIKQALAICVLKCAHHIKFSRLLRDSNEN